MSTPFRFLLPTHLLAAMVAQAQAELPNECCGLLAGTVGADGVARAVRRYPLVNVLASPTEYEADAKELFRANRDLRGTDIEILAVYHSHPTSAPVPSRKDCERNYMGVEMHFIIGLAGETPEVRAWRLIGDDYAPATFEVVIEP